MLKAKFLSNLTASLFRMASTSTFFPPEAVKGMTEFDPGKFEKTIQIPALRVPARQIGRIMGLKVLQDNFLKAGITFKRVINAETDAEKLCLFDPDKMKDEAKAKEVQDAVNKVLSSDIQMEYKEFSLKYEDWDVKKCLKAIMPDGLDFSSHTQTGHILHLNLREELRPFRFVIAKILLDKIPYAKTIVNKSDQISAKFRFFELELLGGEPNYECVVQEHGYKFKLDFSKVFWNSRLNNEHNRIVQEIRNSAAKTVLFDIFAGVGPFVIPAAFSANTFHIYANDLNPDSTQYLDENVKLNHVKKEKVTVSTLDGKEFIKNVIPNAVTQHLKDNGDVYIEFHAIMNLPALAVTFLSAFKGLLNGLNVQKSSINFFVHVHCFPKASADVEPEWYQKRAIEMVEEQLGAENITVVKSHFVRNVAGRKDMYCVSFKPSNSLLFEEKASDLEKKVEIVKNSEDYDEVEVKRARIEV